MKHHQVLYIEFIKKYIEQHSKYKLNDRVNVLTYKISHKDYLISGIDIDENGEFIYRVTSPRSDSTFPKGFTEDELSPFG